MNVVIRLYIATETLFYWLIQYYCQESIGDGRKANHAIT